MDRKTREELYNRAEDIKMPTERWLSLLTGAAKEFENYGHEFDIDKMMVAFPVGPAMVVPVPDAEGEIIPMLLVLTLQATEDYLNQDWDAIISDFTID